MIVMELTTSLLLLANTLSMAGTADAAVKPTVDRTSGTSQTNLVLEAPQSFKEYVRFYFEDTPILAAIAKCESDFRQYDKDGTVLRGESNPYDVGVMQINEKYHLKDSAALGFDIYSVQGNLAYAKYLYNKEGSKPWNSSAKCWTQSAAGKELARNN